MGAAFRIEQVTPANQPGLEPLHAYGALLAALKRGALRDPE